MAVGFAERSFASWEAAEGRAGKEGMMKRAVEGGGVGREEM